VLIHTKLFAATAAVAVLAAGSAIACGDHLAPPAPPAPPAAPMAPPAPPAPPAPMADMPEPPAPPAPPPAPGYDDAAYSRGDIARAHAALERSIEDLNAAIQARTAAIRAERPMRREAIRQQVAAEIAGADLDAARIGEEARAAAIAGVDARKIRADILRDIDVEKIRTAAMAGVDARKIRADVLRSIDVEKIRADAVAAAEAGRFAAAEARQMTEALRPQIDDIRRQADQLRAMCADDAGACDIDIDIAD
jgi:2-oxoglutarate dehydrogenase E2 component (dihydrolipoamide succinyltransferase)